MIFEIIGVIIWIICGVISYGVSYAESSHNSKVFDWTTRDKSLDNFENRGFAFISGLLGPLSLFSILIDGSYKYGLKYKR